MDRENTHTNDEIRKDDPRTSDKEVTAEKGSKSDPQLTELDGLKKGGVAPPGHPEDSVNEDQDR